MTETEHGRLSNWHKLISSNQLADFYTSQGRYAEAKPFYELAISCYEQGLEGALKNYSAEMEKARSLLGLAEIYRRQRLYDKAEAFYKQALKIEQATWEISNPQNSRNLTGRLLTRTLFGLAVLYRDQGRQDDAVRIFEQAVLVAGLSVIPYDLSGRIMGEYARLLCMMNRRAGLDKLTETAIVPTCVERRTVESTTHEEFPTI